MGSWVRRTEDGLSWGRAHSAASRSPFPWEALPKPFCCPFDHETERVQDSRHSHAFFLEPEGPGRWRPSLRPLSRRGHYKPAEAITVHSTVQEEW